MNSDFINLVELSGQPPPSMHLGYTHLPSQHWDDRHMLLNITYFMSAKDSDSGCHANMAGTLLTEPYPQIVAALIGFMNLTE